MNFTVITPEDPRWRTHAVKHAKTPLQGPAWLETLTTAYRLKATIAALVDDGGAITAALPMIGSKLPWRKRWTALPFTDVLEPVAVDSAHAQDLLGALSTRHDMHPILVRTRTELPGWVSREVGTTHLLDLEGGRDGVLARANRTTRQHVRVAERPENGLRAVVVSSRSEFMGPHLTLVAQSRSRVGVPTQPRRYWSGLWHMHEREEALTVMVYSGESPAASALFLLGRDHAVFKYSASQRSSRHLRTNHLALVTAIEHLSAKGMGSLDFGLTDLRNHTLAQYKRQWGGEEQPAYFSATHANLLPDTVEPGRLLSATLQRTPPFVGRTVGSIAYPFAA